MKVVDLKKSIHDLCKEDPEVLDIMKELGFKDISNSGMLNTAGRFMTIKKGADMKGIGLEKIKETFRQKGYEVVE